MYGIAYIIKKILKEQKTRKVWVLHDKNLRNDRMFTVDLLAVFLTKQANVLHMRVLSVFIAGFG